MTSAATVHALLARLWPRLPDGNVTLSPYSAAVALSSAARGARGETLVAMLPEVVASLAPADVALTLPPWTMRTALDLSAALRDAGMPTAFTGDADFSAMTRGPARLREVWRKTSTYVNIGACLSLMRSGTATPARKCVSATRRRPSR